MIAPSPTRTCLLCRTVAFLPLLVLVAACVEDEQSCYDKISADLLGTSEFARKSGDFDYADAAIDSGYAALAILVDDARNICDYVTAGAYLERK